MHSGIPSCNFVSFVVIAFSYESTLSLTDKERRDDQVKPFTAKDAKITANAAKESLTTILLAAHQQFGDGG